MACLLSLSVELKLNIIEQIDPVPAFIPAPAPELISLSRVCKVLRALTLPYLFRDITLLNEERNGASILRLLHSPHAGFVQKLHYIGIMGLEPEPTNESDETDKVPSLGDLPSSVEQVLSNLAMLPNMKKLIIQFCFAKTAEDDEEANRGTCDLDNELDDYEETVEAESTEAHRSLMERSYTALTRNPASTIENLELRDIAANPCSTWWSKEFKALLPGLSSFTISLRGGDNGAGWCINKVYGYPHFINALDRFFFRHLSDTKHLSFSATEDGPPGLAGHMNHVSLPLHKGKLPKLQTLELKHVFISEELAAFILDHGTSLESIRLNECYSGLEDSLAFDPLSWGEFFSTLAAGNTKRLRSVVIGASSLELIRPQDMKERDWKYGEAVEAKELRETIPTRRMYEYRCLDDKYGMLFDNEELSFRRFQDGRDHAAWERLCEVLRNNAEAEL